MISYQFNWINSPICCLIALAFDTRILCERLCVRELCWSVQCGELRGLWVQRRRRWMWMNGGVCRCIAEGVTGGYLASGGSLLLFDDCLWIARKGGYSLQRTVLVSLCFVIYSGLHSSLTYIRGCEWGEPVLHIYMNCVSICLSGVWMCSNVLFDLKF